MHDSATIRTPSGRASDQPPDPTDIVPLQTICDGGVHCFSNSGARRSTLGDMESLSISHQIAHRLARAGLRGSQWYWRAVDRLQQPPPPGLVRLPDGMSLVHDPSDWTCRAAYQGTYEREILRLLRDLLHPGETVIDVGANVGIITTRAAGIVGPTGRVIAVEPSPRCIRELIAVTNDMGNVTVVEAALGDETGTVALAGWDNPDHRGLGSVVPGHRAGLAENWHEGVALQVPQMRLDDLLDEQVGDEGEIALIKIDVEGYEPVVLRGAPNLFGSHRVRAALLEVTTTLPVEWVGELLSATVENYAAFAVEESGRIRRRPTLTPVDADSAIARSEEWNLLLRRR